MVAHPLDRKALTAAVTSSKPDAVVHQLTALAHAGNFKKLDEEFALTNRFRTEVTDTLIAAGRAIRIPSISCPRRPSFRASGTTYARYCRKRRHYC